MFPDRLELDEILILATAILPQFFTKRKTQQVAGGVAPVVETLMQQFLPKKDGNSVNEEILLAEIGGILKPDTKIIYDKMLKQLAKGEKQFFAIAIATFAAKYQKGKKHTTPKTPDGKEGTVIESLEPLTPDNPAILFLEETLSGKKRSVLKTIEELRSKSMIRKSSADILVAEFNKYKKAHKANTEEAVLTFLQSIVNKQDEDGKQKVGPLGLLIALFLGRWNKVEFFLKSTSSDK